MESKPNAFSSMVAVLIAVCVAALTTAPAVWAQQRVEEEGSNSGAWQSDTRHDDSTSYNDDQPGESQGEAEQHYTGKLEDEHKRAEMARQTLLDLMNAGDHSIPRYMLDRAKGIAVIPHMVKGGFVIGGSGGKGFISARQPNGSWNGPLLVTIGGGSFGWQAGIESVNLVLVFTDDRGLNALINSKVELGANVSAAAGPIGRTAQAGTNVTLHSSIYSYSQSKGLFAGAVINGAVLQIDNSGDERVYGHEVNANRVLLGETQLQTPEVLEPFMSALREVAPTADFAD